jgi:hypothetical protein
LFYKLFIPKTASAIPLKPNPSALDVALWIHRDTYMNLDTEESNVMGVENGSPVLVKYA